MPGLPTSRKPLQQQTGRMTPGSPGGKRRSCGSLVQPSRIGRMSKLYARGGGPTEAPIAELYSSRHGHLLAIQTGS